MGFRWLEIIWQNKLKASFFALAWVLVSYVLRLPFRLAEDLMFDTLNERISRVWVILMSIFVEWVIPILLAVGAVWLVYWMAGRERNNPQLQTEVERKLLELVDSFPRDNEAIITEEVKKISLKFNKLIDRKTVGYSSNYYIRRNTRCQWNICGSVPFFWG